MLQIFKDEVIDGNPKYNITDNGDGTSAIDLANEVIQEGDAFNKNNFDIMQGFTNGTVSVQANDTIVETFGGKTQTTSVNNDGDIVETTTQRGVTYTRVTSIDVNGNIVVTCTET